MTLKLGEPTDPRIPWVRRVHLLDAARSNKSAGPKLDALKEGGRALGDALREDGQVRGIRTLPLTTLLYPLSFAFNRAMWRPSPYVRMTHRSLLIQVDAGGETRNILFNPTDYDAARATPFFRKLIDRFGERGARWVTKEYGQAHTQLSRFGLSPEDIHVVAFDHFHTQDLRPILGVPKEGIAARYPNAYLLAPRPEWEDWDHLHPLQRPWFIPDGKEGVSAERVILTEHDLHLGQGAMLLRTPGHTTGNQTLFAHGARGVFGCSENATSADGWAPRASRIKALNRFANLYDAEVVLNSNTPELCAEQYSSMILERSVVDRAPENDAFPQMFPSSEVTRWWLTPGIKPTVVFGERDSGEITPS